jgi:hypothetical protein
MYFTQDIRRYNIDRVVLNQRNDIYGDDALYTIIPPGQKSFKVTKKCILDPCRKNIEIVIYGLLVHAHSLAIKIWVEVLRKKKGLHNDKTKEQYFEKELIFIDSHFDHEIAGTYQLKKKVHLFPSDIAIEL